MNKLNWRDASKELPKDSRNVVVAVKIGDVTTKGYDYYNKQFKDWSCHSKDYGCEVILWLDLDDIPLPEE